MITFCKSWAYQQLLLSLFFPQHSWTRTLFFGQHAFQHSFVRLLRIRFHFQLISDLKLHFFSLLNELVVGRMVSRNYTCSIYTFCILLLHGSWFTLRYFALSYIVCMDSFYGATTYFHTYNIHTEGARKIHSYRCVVYFVQHIPTHTHTYTQTRLLNPIILCNYCYYHFCIVCFGTEARFFAFHLSFWYVCLYNTTVTFMYYSNSSRLIFLACFRMFSINPT